MLDRLVALPSWRVAAPLAVAVVLAGPGVAQGPFGTGSGGGGVARQAASAAVPVCEATVERADGLRDGLRRDGANLLAPGPIDGGRADPLCYAGARRLAGPGPLGAAEGAILSRMSRSLARWKGGGSP